MEDVKKILIADDEPEIRKLVSLLLKKKGYAVSAVKNGAEAVAAVEGNADFDLIVLDILMPDLSGIEAARQIRLQSPVPILFLTA